MSEHHENRRVQMTRRLLKEALLELLEHTELARISVTALCQKADVHRSTFYQYYTDPSALLQEIETDFFRMIPVPPEVLDPGNQKKLLLTTAAFFDTVREHRKSIRILFSQAAGDDFAARLVAFLCDGYIPFPEGDDGMSDHFKRLYVANGTVGMMREWISADCPIDSQQLAGMMYSFSRKVLS